MQQLQEKHITIEAPVSGVWKAITDIRSVREWMGGDELELEVTTSWEMGTPLVIRGFHHVRFENKGIVLEFTPERVMSYSFLSSVSRLPDLMENYSVVRFELREEGMRTLLTLQLFNFPTETIYHHLNFYWNSTLMILKRMVESR